MTLCAQAGSSEKKSPEPLGADEDGGTSIVLVQNAHRVRRALRDGR